MKELLEVTMRVDEVDLAKALGTAALAGSLLTSTPSSAMAAHKVAHHHHREVVKHYSEQDYINTIVGEASNQGHEGMLAVACAIRNRMKHRNYRHNVLKGVFGRNADHTKNEPQSVFDEARQAWKESATTDVVGGAYLWGNDNDVVKFKQQDWFRNVEQTVRIGGHTFFRDIA